MKKMKLLPYVINGIGMIVAMIIENPYLITVCGVLYLSTAIEKE